MRTISLFSLIFFSTTAFASPPVASYLFPAGGQRGAKIEVRVGGLFLHEKCRLHVLGSGVEGSPWLERMPTRWLEGPILPLPESQRQEDYPQDMAGSIAIAADASPGIRFARLSTSQGAAPSLKFMVGHLPEILETEIDGDPQPVDVPLPITINGRIFPREDLDLWRFQAKKGETIHLEVHAARLGTPLDARLEILDESGRRLAESDHAQGPDPTMVFTAPADGLFLVRIQDSQLQGSQAHVYRLTLTKDPVVRGHFPLGGRRGSTVDLQLTGTNLRAKVAKVTIPGDAASSFSPANLDLLLDADDVPEHFESNGAVLVLPVMANGRIEKPGEIDRWSFPAKKGDAIHFDLRAGRLGSPLDGVLTVTDAAGKVLAREDAGEKQLDPRLRFTPPADGVYVATVQDRFRGRAGEAFAYRLKIASVSEGDFELRFPIDAVSVLRKGQGKLKLNVERTGHFKEAIDLTFSGLPEGVAVTPMKIAANQNALELTFSAKEDAKIQSLPVRIEGTATVGGEKRTRVAQLAVARGEHPVDSILLGVAIPTPFTLKGEYDMGFAPRGSMHRRKYVVERQGYDGPIEVRLADRQARHLQGVVGPTIAVPAGAKEFTYSAYLPPWMETGRTCRVCVMGTATVKDADGSEHRVSFSSVNQNEQLVAVVGPGRLALELERGSGLLSPGQNLEIPVKIKRGQDLVGPVTLELVVPNHVKGVTSAKATITADREGGVLIVSSTSDLKGEINIPLLVRATLMHQGDPVIAEAKIDLQPK